MQTYMRPRCEGYFALRALMKSALPLLSNAMASQAGSSFRVWGSWSDYCAINAITPRIVRQEIATF